MRTTPNNSLEYNAAIVLGGAHDVAQRILLSVECQMKESSLLYDLVCKLNQIHMLKTTPYDERMENHENHALHATHQIVESWIHTSQKILERIVDAVLSRTFEKVAEDCYVVERILKLLAEAEESTLDEIL
ncbi:Nematode resistance protein-like HSPRO2 [Glycine soja]